MSIILLCCLISSCGSDKLITTKTTYQSVRLAHPKNPESADNAEILLSLNINSDGVISGKVFNLTNDIMIIDQTLSFFVNPTGQSTSYYDPTLRTETISDLSSATSGASVNLGAVSNALGIGGQIGSLLRGVNVGGSSTNGQTVTNTTYIADQPRVSIGPKGSIALTKEFKINRLGTNMADLLEILPPCDDHYESYSESPVRFSVCITYSLDGGNTFKNITTEMYMNSEIIAPIQNGEINQSLRTIYANKADAIYEPWWMIYVPNNVTENSHFDTYVQGTLIDFQ